MAVYYIVLVFSLLFLSPYVNESDREVPDGQRKNTRKRAKTGFILFCIMLMFVAGFRFRVGADFGGYYYSYKERANGFIEKLKTLDEPGLAFVDRVGYLFVKDNVGGTLFPAVITMFLICRNTYKYSTDLFFSGMLILFTCWDSCFNGVRQAFAAAILYCGFPYLRDKNLWKYALIVFIAYLFHKSSVIMLPAYLVCRNKVNTKNVVLLLVGSLIILFSYDRLFNVLDVIMDKEYSPETNEYISNAINPLRVAIHCAPACYYLIMYRNREKNDMQNLCLNFTVIRAVMMIAASGSAMLGRIGMYTSTMCLIAIPELNRGLDRNTRNVMRRIILGLYCFVWLYELAGSGSLNHFQFVWQR